jgi:hypothetical protein
MVADTSDRSAVQNQAVAFAIGINSETADCRLAGRAVLDAIGKSIFEDSCRCTVDVWQTTILDEADGQVAVSISPSLSFIW